VLNNPEPNHHLSSADQIYKKIYVMPMLGDVDGDGLPDLIEREMIGDRSLYGCFTTTQPAVHNTVHVYLSTRRNLLSVPDRYASYGPVSRLDLYPMDFNGNGKLDLMNVFTQESSILEYNNLTHSFVHLLGNGPQGFPTQYHKFIQLGDFNGDGKTDLLCFVDGNWHIAYSNGQGFHEYNASSLWFSHSYNADYCGENGFNFELGDYNGDGRTDILERHNHGQHNNHTGPEIYIYYSQGFGFHKTYIGTNNTAQNGNRYKDSKNIISDFNGDGKSDVLMGDYSDTHTTIEIAIESFDLKNKRVSGINYSDVHSFEFSYALLNKYNKYFRTSDTNTFSMAKTVNIPLYVVSSFKQKVVGFTDVEMQYSYKNLLYHTHGRGLLGFTDIAVVKIDGGGTNRTTISKNKQDPQLTYKLNTLSTEVFNHCTNLSNPFGNTQNPIAKTTFEYGITETSANSKTVFSFCSYMIETDYLKNTEKSTCFSYDVYGNMIHSSAVYSFLGSNGNVEYIQSVDNKFEQKGTWIPASLSITRSTNIRYNGTPSYVVQKEIKNNNWGIPVEVESFKNNLHYYVKELTSYDKYGNIVTTSLDTANNATGNTFRLKVLSYNNGKELTKETNALGSQKEVTIEPIYGNILYSKQDDGIETSYDYNTWGQLIKESNVGDNSIGIEREYVSSPAGAYYKITKIGNLGNWVTEYYNARNQKIQKDYSGLDQQVHRQRWIYNTRGLLVQESNVFDPQTASSIKWNYYSYDIYDRLRGVNYENNLLTSAISYDKNKKTINSGANRIKEIYEDASGNVVKVVDNGGTITYKYGAHNKLVETDANGSVISIIYNVQLNKIELHEPNAGVTQYDYNAFGDLIAQVDANGNTFFFHYDAIGRLIKKAKTNEEYLYSYNNSPGLGKNNKLAEELYKVNNTEVHRINYSHTAEGLVSAVIEVIKGTTTYATSYHYDTYLRLSRIDYPNITVGYGYDATNNLVELFDGNSNLLWRKNATFTDGRTNQFELGNGFVTELSFNADAQLQNIMSTKQGFPNAINLGYNFNLLTILAKVRSFITII
jgi:YD repeat-containing protein